MSAEAKIVSLGVKPEKRKAKKGRDEQMIAYFIGKLINHPKTKVKKQA